MDSACPKWSPRCWPSRGAALWLGGRPESRTKHFCSSGRLFPPTLAKPKGGASKAKTSPTEKSLTLARLEGRRIVDKSGEKRGPKVECSPPIRTSWKAERQRGGQRKAGRAARRTTEKPHTEAGWSLAKFCRNLQNFGEIFPQKSSKIVYKCAPSGAPPQTVSRRQSPVAKLAHLLGRGRPTSGGRHSAGVAFIGRDRPKGCSLGQRRSRAAIARGEQCALWAPFGACCGRLPKTSTHSEDCRELATRRSLSACLLVCCSAPVLCLCSGGRIWAPKRTDTSSLDAHLSAGWAS